VAKPANVELKNSFMKAMIFSAGLGTRFKPWTDAHPKALAVVNGKSLLQRNIEWLQRFNIHEVIVNIHHFPEQVMQAIEKNKGWGSKITISDEKGQLLETGGGLKKARSFFDVDQPFLTTNVDILTNLDVDKLLRFHTQKRPLISFAVTDRKTSRYFLFDEGLRLCGWENTKTGEKKISIQKDKLLQKAYSCVVIFQPEIFSLMKRDGKFSLVDVYLDLAAKHTILGYDHTGDLLVDVGKPDAVALAEKMFL
jgi:MurNAc alpha-1-phosphate uridylyltransferase